MFEHMFYEGKEITTEKDFMTIVNANTLFKKIKSKAKKVGLDIAKAYIIDNKLVISDNYKIHERQGGKMDIYVRGFNADNKTAKVDIYRPLENRGTEVKTIDDYILWVKEHENFCKFVKWFTITDMTALPHFYNTNELVNETCFATYSNGIDFIKKEIANHYNDKCSICGGVKRNDKIVVFVANEQTFQAKFDVFVFKNDKKEKVFTNIIEETNIYTHSDFFIDEVQMPKNDNDFCEIVVRKVDDNMDYPRKFVTKQAIYRLTKNFEIIKGVFKTVDVTYKNK